MTRFLIVIIVFISASWVSCQEKQISKDVQKILTEILEESNLKSSNNYDLIIQGSYNGEIYYEVWSGSCFPPTPMYYTKFGDFFCMLSHSDSLTLCDSAFELSDKEVIFRTEGNCASEPTIDKYQIMAQQ